MSHAMRLVKTGGNTWNYSCSCNKVKRDGLRSKASAETIHAAHIRSLDTAKKK